MIKDSEKFADEDKKVKDRVDAKNELESYAYSLKTQLSDKEKLGGGGAGGAGGPGGPGGPGDVPPHSSQGHDDDSL
ncbi:unnamed protein product [Rotaria socialis]|uniref:Heat shock protein 70 n=1 Tax=Rotaria socialis TaxID=392032 RepID=A0A817JZ11_9BILA|nr:unnamed protein product [Rotaria socialis]